MSHPNSISMNKSAAGVAGLHDHLRDGFQSSVSHQLNDQPELEARLQGWDQRLEDQRLASMYRVLGPGAPIRRLVELEAVSKTSRPNSILREPSNIHQDILLNKETKIDWEDIYSEDNKVGGVQDFHAELQQRMNLRV